MLRLFHIVLVLGNRVKILKLPLYSIQFLHQITTPIRRRESRAALYSIQFLHQITTEPFPYLRRFPEGSLFLNLSSSVFRCGRRESFTFRSWKEARRRVRTGRFRVFRLCKNGLRAGRRVELVRTVPRRSVCCGLKIQNRLYGFFPVLSFSPGVRKGAAPDFPIVRFFGK